MYVTESVTTKHMNLVVENKEVLFSNKIKKEETKR